MYPYHNTIKKRIRNGELIGFEYVDNYKNIGECLLLLFSTPPFERPIRPHKYHDYDAILAEWKRKKGVEKMTQEKELNDLMVELLESNTEWQDSNAKFTDRGFEIINEISDYAEQTQIFQKGKEKGEMFSCATAQQVFCYMLDRIVNAPTTLQRDLSVILIMPFVREKLQNEIGADNDVIGNIHDNPELLNDEKEVEDSGKNKTASFIINRFLKVN